MGLEIERKWLVKEEILKKQDSIHLEDFDYRDISQGYLCAVPVIRIRKSIKKSGESHYMLSYKGRGLLEREEYNLPLTAEAYESLKGKIEGRLIEKRRYILPFGKYKIELDIFKGKLEGLIYAEVEFPSKEEAENFSAPEWFNRELTEEPGNSNADLALRN
ncbi:CYTH domain-containing protein [Oribacterium parvum]|uniref:CYTH domain-containing protein n=1 Tax=Oribacterium parvum TaxID=1501329 RepID=UPI0028E8812E|nr:CYTH domain-containing protein [Oribacterium parvum]